MVLHCPNSIPNIPICPHDIVKGFNISSLPNPPNCDQEDGAMGAQSIFMNPSTHVLLIRVDSFLKVQHTPNRLNFGTSIQKVKDVLNADSIYGASVIIVGVLRVKFKKKIKSLRRKTNPVLGISHYYKSLRVLVIYLCSVF